MKNLPNILEKLNNIKIEDLRQYIDVEKIKNINADQVKEFVLSRPDLITKILFITITFFVVTSSFSSYQAKNGTLNQDIAKMETLLTAVNTYNDTKKEYDAFIKTFPQGIPSAQVLDKLSDLANQNNIQIATFSPAQEKDFTLWQLTNTSINVSAEDYTSMIKFILAIEDPKNALRIDSWSGLLDQGQKKSDNSSEGTKAIRSTINIGAVKLKNE